MSFTVSDISLNAIQVAFFFLPNTVFRPVRFASTITEALGEVFPQDPNIISLPPNVPLEFPRIMFTNDKGYSLNISLNRADFQMNVTDGKDIHQVYLPIITKLHDDVFEPMKINIQRVGLVNTYALLSCKTQDIITKYFMPGKIDDSDEINLAWHKIQSSGEFKNNLWVRINVTDKINANCNVIIDLNSSEDIESLGNKSIDVLNKYEQYIRENLANVIGCI